MANNLLGGRRVACGLTWLVLLSVGDVGCIPTVARTNARIEPGVDVALVAAAGALLEGEDETGATTETRLDYVHAEVGVQYGRRFESNAGFSVQLKVPLAFLFTTLDVYYEAPSTHPWFYGVGGELGVFPGVYGTVTRYLNRTSFLTFTQRVSFGVDENAEGAQINPQLAFGIDNGLTELTLFASYAVQTGRGLNVEICLFDSDCKRDYRNQFVLGGMSARF